MGLNEEFQNLEVVFSENKNYYQIGSSYLYTHINVRSNDNVFFDDYSPIKLTNNGSAFYFKEESIHTTGV